MSIQLKSLVLSAFLWLLTHRRIFGTAGTGSPGLLGWRNLQSGLQMETPSTIYIKNSLKK
jgi:hypothetical protein